MLFIRNIEGQLHQIETPVELEGHALLVGTKIQRPYGGYWEVRSTESGGLHVVRFTGSGKFVYATKPIIEGDVVKLEAKFWERVPNPAEEKDPIKRVMRELGLEVGLLRRMKRSQTQFNVEIRDYDMAHLRMFGGRRTRWIHDGTERTLGSRDYDKLRGAWTHNCEVSQATYAIWRSTYKPLGSGNIAPINKINLVLVWPQCNPEELKEQLQLVLQGKKVVRREVRGLVETGEARRVQKSWLVGWTEGSPEAAHPSTLNVEQQPLFDAFDLPFGSRLIASTGKFWTGVHDGISYLLFERGNVYGPTHTFVFELPDGSQVLKLAKKVGRNGDRYAQVAPPENTTYYQEHEAWMTRVIDYIG